MTYEVKRLNSDDWETGVNVPLAEVVGCLVRYHTGQAPLVLRVAEVLTGENGLPQLRFEPYQPQEVIA